MRRTSVRRVNLPPPGSVRQDFRPGGGLCWLITAPLVPFSHVFTASMAFSATVARATQPLRRTPAIPPFPRCDASFDQRLTGMALPRIVAMFACTARDDRRLDPGCGVARAVSDVEWFVQLPILPLTRGQPAAIQARYSSRRYRTAVPPILTGAGATPDRDHRQSVRSPMLHNRAASAVVSNSGTMFPSGVPAWRRFRSPSRFSMQ